MDKKRKIEIDQILKKTEEDIKKENFKDMSWEEFFKRQNESEIDEKLIDDFLKNDEELEKRADDYDQNKKYEGFFDINVE